MLDQGSYFLPFSDFKLVRKADLLTDKLVAPYGIV